MESRKNIPKKKKKNINGITKKIPKGLHIAPDLSKGAINRANRIKKLEAEAAKAMKNKKKKKIAPIPKNRPEKRAKPYKVKKSDPMVDGEGKIVGYGPEKRVIKKMGGGKIQYRSIGGKVLDGNDITKMIYD